MSPANEVTVYATSPGGAEFYVDDVHVMATECGFSSTDAWAFLWAHDTSGSYTPTSLYAASSSGLPPTVDWSGGVGTAVVTLPGVGTESGGSIQVNAYGSHNERCKIGAWKEVGADVRATVYCTWPNGTPTNTTFVLAYVRKASPSIDPGGYVFADQPTTTEYVPALLRQWNSSGIPNVVHRLTTGTYLVEFPGVIVNHCTVLVTAHGSGGAHCATGGWNQDSVVVYCYDTAGTLADQEFVLNFSEAWPNLATSFAYAWAHDPWAAAYTPAFSYQRNVLGPPGFPLALPVVDASRASTGSYFMAIPDQSAFFSNALVVAYGPPSGAYCKPHSWMPLAGRPGTEVRVRCFSGVGQPTDSQYDLAYTTF